MDCVEPLLTGQAPNHETYAMQRIAPALALAAFGLILTACLAAGETGVAVDGLR